MTATPPPPGNAAGTAPGGTVPGAAPDGTATGVGFAPGCGLPAQAATSTVAAVIHREIPRPLVLIVLLPNSRAAMLLHSLRPSVTPSSSARLRLARRLCMLAAFVPSALLAQMGGMGGMGGMRGGGMGRGGMGRGGMGGPRMESPAERARKTIEEGNPFTLLLEHKKPLQLSKAQQDTFKSYAKELKERQEPLFKTLDQLFGDARGGGRPGSRGGMLPDSAKTLLDRLVDIQDAYRDRAYATLDSTQRLRVDSIQNAIVQQQREKAEKERESFEKRRRG
ncbi:MAG: hypothetical protein K2R93_06570 [Gemmatimonadaceae bacterium]|nr:hypothetical protein [Gemmatimonadaceae bacterium]